jgi:hypothetical protein
MDEEEKVYFSRTSYLLLRECKNYGLQASPDGWVIFCILQISNKEENAVLWISQVEKC